MDKAVWRDDWRAGGLPDCRADKRIKRRVRKQIKRSGGERHGCVDSVFAYGEDGGSNEEIPSSLRRLLLNRSKRLPVRQKLGDVEVDHESQDRHKCEHRDDRMPRMSRQLRTRRRDFFRYGCRLKRTGGLLFLGYFGFFCKRTGRPSRVSDCPLAQSSVIRLCARL
jgi:hypothetical protein